MLFRFGRLEIWIFNYTFPLNVHSRNPLKLNFTVPYCGFSLACEHTKIVQCATPHSAFDLDFLAVLESQIEVINYRAAT